jgi:Flp pilus assembly protein TadD
MAQTGDYQQGVALFEKGDSAGAIPFLTRAASADPKNAQKWKALGVAYAAQQKYSEAESPFARACELDAMLPDACYFYARALYALDRYEASLAALDRADSHFWKVRLARAQALEALGRAGAAEKEFYESVALCQGADPGPGAGLGRFLVRQGRSSEAIALLTKIVNAHPASAEARIGLGRALFEAGDVADAVPHLERAVALTPASAQAHLLLGKAYTRSGREADARRHLDLAAKYGEEK